MRLAGFFSISLLEAANSAASFGRAALLVNRPGCIAGRLLTMAWAACRKSHAAY
jgi:hypothetical protein